MWPLLCIVKGIMMIESPLRNNWMGINTVNLHDGLDPNPDSGTLSSLSGGL